jgi:hypothetical protein
VTNELLKGSPMPLILHLDPLKDERGGQASACVAKVRDIAADTAANTSAERLRVVPAQPAPAVLVLELHVVLLGNPCRLEWEHCEAERPDSIPARDRQALDSLGAAAGAVTDERFTNEHIAAQRVRACTCYACRAIRRLLYSAFEIGTSFYELAGHMYPAPGQLS